MKQREKWIDIAKGILIILVVLGHSHANRVLDYVINSFHMAGFFILSGITFKANDPFKVFLLKKIKRLLLPYVGFAILLLAYQFTSHVLFKSEFSFFSGLTSIVLPISGRSSTTVYHLWFLPCLFLTNVLCFWILRLFEWGKTFAFILYIVVSSICLLTYSITGVSNVISVLPISSFFVLVGWYFSDWIKSIQYAAWKTLSVSAVLFLVTIYFNYRYGADTVDMSSMSFGIWSFYLMSGLMGSVAIISISQIIGKNSILEIIGINSIYYYGLHYEILGAVSKIRGGGIIATAITLLILYFCVDEYLKLKSIIRRGCKKF